MKPINQQKILALETCTMICSVAVWDGNQLHEKVVESARSHSQQLLPMCEDVLAQAELTLNDIDAIACTRGPGAFTGLRIGVGVAKGLAYGQNLPIYAVSSLAALAHRVMQSDNAERVYALLDARMGELYAAEYENQNGFPHRCGKEHLSDIEHVNINKNINKQLFAGTGATVYAKTLRDKGALLSSISYPTAADVIALVQSGNIEAVSASALAPVYLRDKVTG